jgi:hypothetical protein
MARYGRKLTRDLKEVSGVKEVAKFLCRAGTVDEVKRKCEALGLEAKGEEVVTITRGKPFFYRSRRASTFPSRSLIATITASGAV